MKAAVVGSGAWGTALAIRLCKNGHDVTLWTFEKDLIPQMEQERINIRLPGVKLPEGLKISADYACVADAQLVVIATPSFPIRGVCRGIAPYLREDALLVSVTKGLEDGSQKRMSQVVAEETGHDTVVLTGPSHAEEVAVGLPTGCLAAHTDKEKAEAVQAAFMGGGLRIYTSPDPVGAELGGALKNIIAVCSGICDGLLENAANTKAALMTRGITEIARLGVALGGRQETFAGLSGIGDLMLTCSSNQSRNYRFGQLLSQGMQVQEAMDSIGMVVEGYHVTGTAYELAQSMKVDMPIVTQAYEVLYQNKNPYSNRWLFLG